MGIMLLGEDVPPMEGDAYPVVLRVAGILLGIDYRAFYLGFDYDEGELQRDNRGSHLGYKDHPDYRLGVACREAVLAAGYTL